jgi:hypothetical protein
MRDFLSSVTGIQILKMLRKPNSRDGGAYQWRSRAGIGVNQDHMQCIMKKSEAPEEVNMANTHPTAIRDYGYHQFKIQTDLFGV